MFIEAVGAAVCVAIVSLVGVLFFGDSQKLIGAQKYIIPTAVGVFLSLVLFELIPETLSFSPEYGGIVVAIGFIGFYILASLLHRYFHKKQTDDCGRKEGAMLLLIGDAMHNLADGVILGTAFLVDPAVGVAVAVGIALHEIPQEIVEFGVLVRAGFTRARAALYNLLSASSVIVGTVITISLAEHAEEYVWVLTGIAAGNLLFIATSDLLPRIHGNIKNYGGIWKAVLSIVLGFIVMTTMLMWTHEHFGHGHDEHHEESHEVEVIE